MIINGHELTKEELGQAYAEYKRLCDIEDLTHHIYELMFEKEIPMLEGNEVESLAEKLVDEYRSAIDNRQSICEAEYWIADEMIIEEFE